MGVDKAAQDVYQRYRSAGIAGPLATESGGGHARFVAHLASFAESASTRVVLDLGCGSGALLYALQKKGLRAAGVEISPEQAEAATSSGVADVTLGTIGEFLPLYSGDVDLIYCIDVLEHLSRQDILDTLAGCARALRPGGRLVLQVPNGEGIGGMSVRYGDLTHETAFTRTSLSHAMRLTGLCVSEVVDSLSWDRSVKGRVRNGMFRLLTAPLRLARWLEVGSGGAVLTQNLIAVGVKPERPQS